MAHPSATAIQRIGNPSPLNDSDDRERTTTTKIGALGSRTRKFCAHAKGSSQALKANGRNFKSRVTFVWKQNYF